MYFDWFLVHGMFLPTVQLFVIALENRLIQISKIGCAHFVKKSSYCAPMYEENYAR